MAHAFGVDYIEQDVVLTRDNIPVILHDIHVDGVSNVAQEFPDRKRKDGRFYAIDFTLNELRQLEIEERFDYKTGKPYFPKRFPPKKSRFQIATLSEEIELIEGLNQSTGRSIGLYVEVKHPEFHMTEKKDISNIVFQVLKKYGYESSPITNGKPRIYVQCFHAATLKRFKNEFKTKIPLVQLIGENDWGESSTDYTKLKTLEGMKDVATYAVGIGPWMKQLLDEKGVPTPLVGWAKNLNLTMHAYTARADQLPEAVKNFDMLHQLMFKVVKVDGLFSDHSDQTVAWVNKNFSK